MKIEKVSVAADLMVEYSNRIKVELSAVLEPGDEVEETVHSLKTRCVELALPNSSCPSYLSSVLPIDYKSLIEESQAEIKRLRRQERQLEEEKEKLQDEIESLKSDVLTLEKIRAFIGLISVFKDLEGLRLSKKVIKGMALLTKEEEEEFNLNDPGYDPIPFDEGDDF